MRLIDANDFIEKMHELYEQAKWGKREIHFSLADLECNVDMMPTIDAVLVIRCKDCAKFKGAYGKEYRDGDGYGYCSGEGPVNGTPCDGYCNEAVRKGEEWMI